MARSADLILLVVDAGSGKAERQKELLEIELNAVGLRLNQKPPNVYFKRKKTGGVSISSTCRLEQISEAAVAQILHEYRIHSAEVLFREDCSVEQFIDLVEGNRKYVRCLCVYHKIDMTSIEEVRRISKCDEAIVLSCRAKLNLDLFLDKIWQFLGLVRVYTKPRGKKPDFDVRRSFDASCMCECVCVCVCVWVCGWVWVWVWVCVWVCVCVWVSVCVYTIYIHILSQLFPFPTGPGGAHRRPSRHDSRGVLPSGPQDTHHLFRLCHGLGNVCEAHAAARRLKPSARRRGCDTDCQETECQGARSE